MKNIAEKNIKQEQVEREEQVEINFLGLKLKITNPTIITLMIVICVLIFYMILIFKIPELALLKSMIEGLKKGKWFSG